ncbi:hypothetical protein P3W45_001061 [Vairimorpha bombi]
MAYDCISRIFSVCTPKKKNKRDIKQQKEEKSSDSTVVSSLNEDLDSFDLSELQKSVEQMSEKHNLRRISELEYSLDSLSKSEAFEEPKTSKKKIKAVKLKKPKEKIKKVKLIDESEKKKDKKTKLKKIRSINKTKEKEIKLSKSTDIESDSSEYVTNKVSKGVQFKNVKPLIERRTFLSKGDLESIQNQAEDFESESEICFYSNEEQQIKFNNNLKRKMKAFLSQKSNVIK